MNRKDQTWLAVLALGAIGVWTRDRSWLAAGDEALPVVAALPLFVWLGRPWRLRAEPGGAFLHAPSMVVAGLLFVAGSALDLCSLCAAAWVAGLWAWLRARATPETLGRARRLLPLAFLAFPWVILDLQSLGWYFRLSGAWCSEHLFGLLGLQVSRAGVDLVVQGLPISVVAACSGLQVLQSLLIAGTFLVYVLLGDTRVYWWNVAALAVAAWVANTARIAAIGAAALTWGRDFATGPFHTLGGLGVFVAAFVVYAAIFDAERRWLARRARAA